MTPTRVLVIDDDAALAETTADALRSVGYDVRATSGSAAVAIARAFAPQLVLLDIKMPDRNGPEVARDLRDDPETAKIPIVVVTGKEDLSPIDRHMPADGWLDKPFSLQQLYAAVGRWAQRAP